MAIPTGIISAGFVEQYTQFKQMGEHGKERDIQFLNFLLLPQDSWTGKCIRDLELPTNTLIAAIRRGTKHSWNGYAIRELDISRREFIVLVKRNGNMIVPHGSLIIREGDTVYLYKELDARKA